MTLEKITETMRERVGEHSPISAIIMDSASFSQQRAENY